MKNTPHTKTRLTQYFLFLLVITSISTAQSATRPETIPRTWIGSSWSPNQPSDIGLSEIATFDPANGAITTFETSVTGLFQRNKKEFLSTIDAKGMLNFGIKFKLVDLSVASFFNFENLNSYDSTISKVSIIYTRLSETNYKFNKTSQSLQNIINNALEDREYVLNRTKGLFCISGVHEIHIAELSIGFSFSTAERRRLFEGSLAARVSIPFKEIASAQLLYKEFSSFKESGEEMFFDFKSTSGKSFQIPAPPQSTEEFNTIVNDFQSYADNITDPGKVIGFNYNSIDSLPTYYEIPGAFPLTESNSNNLTRFNEFGQNYQALLNNLDEVNFLIQYGGLWLNDEYINMLKNLKVDILFIKEAFDSTLKAFQNGQITKLPTNLKYTGPDLVNSSLRIKLDKIAETNDNRNVGIQIWRMLIGKKIHTPSNIGIHTAQFTQIGESQESPIPGTDANSIDLIGIIELEDQLAKWPPTELTQINWGSAALNFPSEFLNSKSFSNLQTVDDEVNQLFFIVPFTHVLLPNWNIDILVGPNTSAASVNMATPMQSVLSTPNEFDVETFQKFTSSKLMLDFSTSINDSWLFLKDLGVNFFPETDQGFYRLRIER